MTSFYPAFTAAWQAAEYARQLDVPAKDAGKLYSDCLAAIKRSRLCKHLEQLNGMKF